MNKYLIEVTEQTKHLISVKAENESEDLALAELQLGEVFTEPETTLRFHKPRLLEAD